MSRLLTLVLAALVAVAPLGCAEPEVLTPDAGPPPRGELNCVDGLDDDGDGLVDCDDDECSVDSACKPPEPRPCGTQKDCGNIVEEIVTKVCVDSKCVAPGPFDRKTGDAIQLPFEFVFKFVGASWGLIPQEQKPKSVVIRLVYPKTIDGKALTCEDLKNRSGTTEADAAKLDNDGEVNLVYRNLYPLTWSSGASTFSGLLTRAPKSKVIMYGEAWFGQRKLQMPTGNRAAVYCQEGVDLEAMADNSRMTFEFVK